MRPFQRVIRNILQRSMLAALYALLRKARAAFLFYAQEVGRSQSRRRRPTYLRGSMRRIDRPNLGEAWLPVVS